MKSTTRARHSPISALILSSEQYSSPAGTFFHTLLPARSLGRDAPLESVAVQRTKFTGKTLTMRWRGRSGRIVYADLVGYTEVIHFAGLCPPKWNVSAFHPRLPPPSQPAPRARHRNLPERVSTTGAAL